jgi:hypothetical protein
MHRVMFHGVYHPAVVGSRGNLGLVICNPASVFSKSAPCDRSTIGQREQPSASARTDAECLTGTTMPDPHPPCRNAGSDCRPPTQHKRRAQELSPRLLNVDSPRLKTPSRPYQVEFRDLPRAAEEGIPGPFNLSLALHRNSIRWLPRGCRGDRCGRGRVGSDVSRVSRLEVGRNLAALDDPKIPLVPFRKILPAIKSLYLSSITLLCSQVLTSHLRSR